MDIAVRRAEMGDASAVMRLLYIIAAQHSAGRPDLFLAGAKKYTTNEFRSLLRDRSRPVLVAVDPLGAVVGYAFCAVNDIRDNPLLSDRRTLTIDDLCVDPAARRRGVGTALWEAVKVLAAELGAHDIDLNVWEFNKSAIGFYNRCGMRTQRRRMEYILPGGGGEPTGQPVAPDRQ